MHSAKQTPTLGSIWMLKPEITILRSTIRGLHFSVTIKSWTCKSAEEDTESSRSLRMFKSRIGLKNHSLKNTDHTTFLSHTDGLQELSKKRAQREQGSSLLHTSIKWSTYLRSLRPGCDTHCSGKPKCKSWEKKTQVTTGQTLNWPVDQSHLKGPHGLIV